ncbi:glycosyltransferase family 4 protein [Methylosinus sp. PW1]|uniref:glycosyltransferase family 4 protein n=1 Tax=Methylosinus sp. PW1 TaxID=107636 RepID=UPI00056420A0|nr:glycosyltransferase family 4 protein [Methylosinus sp. PW1]
MIKHVLFPFIGQEIGGSHVSAFALAQSLAEDFGFRCVVIARKGSLIAQEAQSLGFGVVGTTERTAGRHSPLYDLARVPARMALLRSLRPAIVHTNDIGALQSWLLPAWLARMPVVYHHRALNRRVAPNVALIRAASHVIAISDETTRSVDYLPANRVTTVTDPFANNLATDRAAARAWLVDELGLPNDAAIIGFVGNFWWRKRPEFFIEAAAIIARIEPHAAFVIFGRDGELTAGELEAAASAAGLSDRLHLAGFRLPVERNIAALDLLLMPAMREPFGRTPIEAALLGTPYVATDDAGHSEIWRRWRGGSLVDKDADAAAFADAAIAVLRRPESVLLSEQERLDVASDVSPRRHAEHVIDVYRRLGA